MASAVMKMIRLNKTRQIKITEKKIPLLLQTHKKYSINKKNYKNIPLEITQTTLPL